MWAGDALAPRSAARARARPRPWSGFSRPSPSFTFPQPSTITPWRHTPSLAAQIYIFPQTITPHALARTPPFSQHSSPPFIFHSRNHCAMNAERHVFTFCAKRASLTARGGEATGHAITPRGATHTTGHRPGQPTHRPQHKRRHKRKHNHTQRTRARANSLPPLTTPSSPPFLSTIPQLNISFCGTQRSRASDTWPKATIHI